MVIYLSMLDTQEDKDKFEQLYISYRDMLYYVAYNIVKNEQQAEDAVHQTFLRLIEKFSLLGEISCPQTKSFCVVICRNLAIDMFRKNKKHYSVSLDDSWEEVQDSRLVDEEVIAGVTVETIAHVMKKHLPETYKEVALLHFGNGYSIKEISSALQLPYGTVKKRLQRARILIANKLKQDGFESE